MIIKDLAQREIGLYNEVCSIEGQMEDQYIVIEERGIFDRYKEIHNEYARLCDTDIEALKRGLFIQWYAMCEPSCFTGIGLLNIFAVRHILDALYMQIQNKTIDSELTWMCNYYFQIAEWMFDEHPLLKKIYENGQTSVSVLPDFIDKEAMSRRGQMGIYWNSLNHFCT